ncbi:MAG: hypothetical protein ACREQI_16710 [Candidatus Binataceae bacterium]
MTLNNNVGDIISGTFELTSSDPGEDFEPFDSTLAYGVCASLGGVAVTCTTNVPVPFQFTAEQATTTLTAFIDFHADGDESCAISASASAAPPPPPPPPPGLCPYVPLSGGLCGVVHPNIAAPQSAGGDNCNLVITVTDSGNTVSEGSSQYPYDSFTTGCGGIGGTVTPGDDIEVGVINNSKLPVYGIGLDAGGNQIFAFDGDGINWWQGLPSNPADNSFGGYGGPDAYFPNTSSLTTGPVAFVNPIPPGGTTYFSLQTNVTDPTQCDQLIKPFSDTFKGPTIGLPDQPYEIGAMFTPNTLAATNGLSGKGPLLDAAYACGFTNFDWVQQVTNYPVIAYAIKYPGVPLKVPFHDPPPGGLQHLDPSGHLKSDPSTAYPFYYDSQNMEPPTLQNLLQSPNLEDNETPTTLKYEDMPYLSSLPTTAATPPCGIQGKGPQLDKSKYMAFNTCLVGVNGGNPIPLKKCFTWCSTYNGTLGGVSLLRNLLAPDWGSGFGGVTIISTDEMSDFQGISLTSVNGLPVGGGMLPGGSSAPTQTLSDGDDCNGAFTGTFNGNITVSEGQSCTFANGTINGNVTVRGGTLALYEDIVGGNVQVHGGEGFTIASYTTINGNLQVQNLPAGEQANYVCDSSVNGNLQLHNNGADLDIGSYSPALCGTNGVGGNLQANNNDGAVSVVANAVKGNLQINNNSGATEVSNNSANGNLQCNNNSSITGSGNTAKQAQGQCAGF